MNQTPFTIGRLPVALLALVAVLLPSLACSSRQGPPRKPTHPVEGRVLFEGKPVHNVLVVFHPTGPDAADQPQSTARTDHEGRFKLSTYDLYDGAPVGKYAVTITAEEDQGSIGELPGIYASPQTSGITVEVREGMNSLAPFQLRRPEQ